jgi:hypothetical protein
MPSEMVTGPTCKYSLSNLYGLLAAGREAAFLLDPSNHTFQRGLNQPQTLLLCSHCSDDLDKSDNDVHVLIMHATS